VFIDKNYKYIVVVDLVRYNNNNNSVLARVILYNIYNYYVTEETIAVIDLRSVQAKQN